MKKLILLLSMLGCTRAHAGTELLYGSWDGGDTAAMGTYGTLHISKNSIAWGRDKKHPSCKTGYTLVTETDGILFKNQIGEEFITGPNNQFQTFLIKMRSSKCTGSLGYLRLTLQLDAPTYLEIVEYSPEQSEQGWMHFHKQ